MRENPLFMRTTGRETGRWGIPQIMKSEFPLIYLRFIGGKLLLAIGGHTSISGHPTSGAGVDRQLGVK